MLIIILTIGISVPAKFIYGGQMKLKNLILLTKMTNNEKCRHHMKHQHLNIHKIGYIYKYTTTLKRYICVNIHLYICHVHLKWLNSM